MRLNRKLVAYRTKEQIACSIVARDLVSSRIRRLLVASLPRRMISIWPLLASALIRSTLLLEYS